MAKKNWFRLDNTGKIYPAVSSDKRPNVFSYSAFLTEDVDVTVLNLAVGAVLKRNPTYKVKLKKGVFWFYLEENKNVFLCKEEEPDYLRFIHPERNRDYLFRVLYKKNKLTIVVFHALTDGFGGLNLFNEIIFEYLKSKGKDVTNTGELKPEDAPFILEESLDNFVKYDKKTGYKEEKAKRPFKFDGTPFEYRGCGMVIAKLPVAQLKELALSYSTTVTGYLTGLYIYSIYRCFLRFSVEKNRRISIVVPLNMRKRYSSKTLRNFSLFARVPKDFKQDANLKECIEAADKALKDGVSLDRLTALIHDNVKLEKNFFIKILPLFLKNIVMKLVYGAIGDNLCSANLSNIGICTLPASVNKYVTDMVFTISPTYSCKHDIGVMTYGDYTYISFTRLFVENSIEKFFIKTLSQSCDVVVSGNLWEGLHNEIL